MLNYAILSLPTLRFNAYIFGLFHPVAKAAACLGQIYSDRNTERFALWERCTTYFFHKVKF